MNTKEMLDYIVENTSDIGSFSITFNHQKEVYSSAKEEIEIYFRTGTFDSDEEKEKKLNSLFISAEDREKCFSTNTLWNLHWYKNTPLGFVNWYGSTLDIVLQQACDYINENKK